MSLFGDFKNSGSSFWSVGAGKFVSTALLRRRRLDKIETGTGVAG